MRVFITGVAGLIGSTLAKFYLKKGYEVTGVDNFIGGYESNIPKTVHLYKLDILDTSRLVANTKHTPPYDIFIHCAALAHEGLSVFSPSLITNNIYGGTISAATAAIVNKSKLFINCSSMARYGNISPPFSENMECNPVDPYGLAKLHAEQQLELLSKIYPEFDYYTVVPHNVSGAQQVYTDPFRNVISIMIHQALAGRDIYIYGDGKQKRSFSHVDDAVNAIDKLITKRPAERIFNIGPDDNEITINDLALKVLEHTKSPSRIVHLDARPREVKHAWCSAELSKRVLNYKATKTVDDIIMDIRDYILLNGVGYFNYNLDIQITNKPVPRTWGDERLFNSEPRLSNA